MQHPEWSNKLVVTPVSNGATSSLPGASWGRGHIGERLCLISSHEAPHISIHNGHCGPGRDGELSFLHASLPTFLPTANSEKVTGEKC